MWLLFFVRRYSAKLLYELEFHAARRLDVDALRATSSCSATRSRSSRARRTTSPTSTRASTSPSYLRSWAFEAQLRDYLREPFGNEWFARARGRLAAARAVGAGPAPDRRRAAARGHRARGRDGSRRRPRPRAPPASPACFTSADSADRPRSRDAHSVHVHREGLYDLLGGYEPCIDERSTWGSWRM